MVFVRSLGPHEHRLSRSGLVHSCVTPSCHSVSKHPLNLHDRVWSRCAHECSSKVESGFAVKARARRYQKAESSLLALRTDVSPLVAPHPASRRRSYLWLQTLDLSSEEDLHLSDFTHFEPHDAMPPASFSSKSAIHGHEDYKTKVSTTEL